MSMTNSRSHNSAILQSCNLAILQFSWVFLALAIARPVAAQMTFRHPGVLVNQAQLDFIAGQANAGVDPWASALTKAMTSSYGSPSYTPNPWQTVECGPSSHPNYGCSDERNDALAAYTQALLWYVTHNQAYAQNAIAIMNAWSGTLTGGHINSNAPLQAGWTGSVWPEAAEIIRYTYSGWSPGDVAAFQSMLDTQYVPNLIDGAPCKNGNWELIMTEALMNISVFNENPDWFNRAVSLWRGRVPAYMYLSSDGPAPVPPPRCGTSVTTYWHQTSFVDGLAQETSRDFGHTFWGLAASVNTAETALQQGIDLYSENADRIMAAFEFHDFINNGGSPPDGINVGPTGGNGSTMEIAYNHFVNRLSRSMPETAAQIAKKRPTGANYFLAWETLTHAMTGSIGLSADALDPLEGATEIFPSYNVQNRTSRSIDEVYGTYIDPDDNALTTWTNVCAGEERTELRWQSWPNQETTNIEDYDMMFDSVTQRTAVSQIKSNTGGEPVYLQVTVPGTIRNDNERSTLAEGIDGQWHHWTILFEPSSGHGEIWMDYVLVRTVERPTASRDWYFKNGTYNNGLPDGACSTAYFKNLRHFYR